MMHKKVTIYDIAKEAGVSPATVSRALSRPGLVSSVTIANVRSVAERLGYDMPKKIRQLDDSASTTVSTQRTGLVAVVAPDIANPFQSTCIKVVQNVMASHGYTVIVSDTMENMLAHKLLSNVWMQQIDGAVLIAPRTGEAELRKIADTMPLAIINRSVPGIDQVLSDTRNAVRQAVLSLQVAGVSTITYLAGPSSSWSDSNRHSLIVHEAKRLGMSVTQIRATQPTMESGFKAIGKFLRHPTDALFAFNDIMAIGFMAAAQGNDIHIPADVKVIGFDDIPMSAFTNPTLSTIHLPVEQNAHNAAQLLLHRIRRSNMGGAQTVMEQAMFIERGSVHATKP
ncbi:LacI family DNA-binding transcriptional regulator [Bifidobacterium felsineum]|nr:LacI family DNA-binding transcriptional regulator [Bifidobacterium felsineum]